MRRGLTASVLIAACFACPSVRGEVRIVGSNTFGEELGPALIKGFREANPDMDVTLTSNNSGQGIAGLLEGTCDIGASSRGLNEDEQRLGKSLGIKLRSHGVAYYGVGVIVNSANPIKNLNTRQVRHLFTGVVSNWSQLGGADLPTRIFIPDRSAGTYLGFQELAMDKKPYAADAKELPTYAAIQDAVAGDKSAVGFTAIPLATTPGMKLVSINGIAPNAGAIAFDGYPYIRLVRLFTRSTRQPDDVKAFLRFVNSKEGQRIAESIGFVPRRSPQPTIDLGL